MPKLRIHNFAMSLDGYAAGPDQSLDEPLGVGGRGLHEWAFATRAFRVMQGMEDGGGDVDTVDDRFVAAGDAGIGANILGRNMFAPSRGAWQDDGWKGWWGDEPPYHTPVFVVTHHARDPIPMQGGTTFFFVTGGIESALEQAFAAADGQGRASRRRGGDGAGVPPRAARRRDARGDRADPARRGERLFANLDGAERDVRVRRVRQLAAGRARTIRAT